MIQPTMWKPDLPQALERLGAFWEREILDRPCISIKAPKIPGTNVSPFLNTREYHGDKAALVRHWTDPDTICRERVEEMSQTFFGGEALPAVFQNYGTSGHCNYFGAQPEYGQDTIWFNPILPDTAPEGFRYQPERLTPHLEIAQRLVDEAEGRYFVGMPDSCGTLDAICHLCGTENVLMDLADDPEQVQEAIKIVNAGWKDSCQKFYDISREACGGTVHAWMDLWAPGKLMQMQCDLSVMLSPAMYAQVVMPELEEQCAWLDYPVYHFDGAEQIRHLDMILSLPGLKAIQWTNVAGQPSPVHYLDTLQRIQKAGVGLIVMTPPEDLPKLLDNLSARGLYIHTEAESQQEAERLIAYTAAHFKA